MTRIPLIPTSGNSPEMQRLLTGVRELVLETLQRAGIVRTPTSVTVERAPTGTAIGLSFTTLNRLEPPHGVAFFPPLRPDTVNTPLLFAKSCGSGVVRLLAGPRADGSLPNVNGSPSGYLATGVGLSVALQDGRDWWVR